MDQLVIPKRGKRGAEYGGEMQWGYSRPFYVSKATGSIIPLHSPPQFSRTCAKGIVLFTFYYIQIYTQFFLFRMYHYHCPSLPVFLSLEVLEPTQFKLSSTTSCHWSVDTTSDPPLTCVPPYFPLQCYPPPYRCCPHLKI